MEKSADRTISDSFKYLLCLSSAGGLGETPQTEHAGVDWNYLLQLALEQAVFPVFLLPSVCYFPQRQMKNALNQAEYYHHFPPYS